MEGYPVYGGRVDQITNPGKKTTLRVICPPGTEHKEIYDFENINSLKDYVSHDDGETFDPKFVYPKSMDSKRLQIRYSEDGGELKDGVVEIRRGVDDLSLGESHYAQVRILVDGSHYIKGMAVYSDDLPDGVDVMFNTNKKKGTPKMDVLKPIKDDPDNPFGSLIKEGVNDPDNPTSVKGGQSYYYDKNGKKQLSLINKRAEEGDWGEWADKLPSQFLSKQSRTLIKKQLNLAAADKQSEFDEICSLTNPTVKKALLKSFADDCDAAAVHLQAAALPRQKYQVILPLTSIKDNEVYAPNYKNGETVALVRYPHGGTFEIPVLTVNNKQAEQDNGITALKKKYQAHENDDGYGGAATLISRAKSETSVFSQRFIRKSKLKQRFHTVKDSCVGSIRTSRIKIRIGAHDGNLCHFIAAENIRLIRFHIAVSLTNTVICLDEKRHFLLYWKVFVGVLSCVFDLRVKHQFQRHNNISGIHSC